MVTPSVAARVIQAHDIACKWINRGQVGAFVFVAQRTRQCQIVGLSLAAMFLRHDMVYLMKRKGDCFGQQAILTTASDSFINQLA